MELIDKLKELIGEYQSQYVELNERLDDLSKKELWDLYNQRSIAMEYLNSTIADLQRLLDSENTAGVSGSSPQFDDLHDVGECNASRSSSDEVVGGTLALRTQDENLVICPNSVAHGHMKKTVSGSYWCVNCQRYYQM